MTEKNLIRTLIVDDSAVVRAMLKQVMEEDGRFEIVGVAENGEKAVIRSEALSPDLIVMDFNMPIMNGIEATKVIFKSQKPKPAVVIFTTENCPELERQSKEAEILEVIDKPNLAHLTTEQLRKLCGTMCEIYEKREIYSSLSEKFFQSSAAPINLKSTEKTESTETNSDRKKLADLAKNISIPQNKEKKSDGEIKNNELRKFEVLLIGASTGGPEAIVRVLCDLGKSFPLPILITQHIDSLFDVQFTTWLKNITKMEVSLAQDGEKALPGHIYIAPAEKHLYIKKVDLATREFFLELNDDPPLHFLRPSVDKMFMNVFQKIGKNILAVMLTGMGRDGADGMSMIYEGGGYTICQNEESCIVFGMPKAVIDAGAATEILPLNKIGERILELTKNCAS